MPLSGGPRGPPSLTRALGVGAGRTKEGREDAGGNSPQLRPQGLEEAGKGLGVGGRGSGVGSGSLPQAPPEVAGGGGEGRRSGALG